MVARYLVAPYGGRRAHPDITSALAAAARRGRPALIEIEAGRYDEQLTVRGDVQLVAKGGPGSVVVGRASGPALEAVGGSVRVHGLVLVGRDTDVVGCTAGALTLERTEVRAPGAVCLYARTGTTVTLRDSTFLNGRVLFEGAGGLVERCRFTDADNNGLVALAGARLSVRDSRFEGAEVHGVRVSGAWAEVTGCELTGTGLAAVMADTQARLMVADCVISDVRTDGIAYVERSGGSVDRTRVDGAEHGIAVTSGADPVVRGCAFVGCRDTGINVRTAGRGRFEHCEVVEAGNVAVHVTEAGAPEVLDCRVTRGNVGVAVVEAARGRFGRLRIEDLTSVALRVTGGGKAVFEQVTVERCPTHLETQGDGGTTAEVTGAVLRDFSMSAVETLGRSRVTLRGVSAERGMVGFAAAEESQLFVYDCDVRAVSVGGAAAMGKGRLVARNLTVTDSEGIGLLTRESARVDVADSEFADCETAGAAFQGMSAGRFADCAVTGTRGLGVLHNGLVELTSLRTSLRIVKQEPEPEPQPTIVHHHQHGPVINGPVSRTQFIWGNGHVNQRQINEEGASDE
ncbi:right-handed parallel beta-helix repeat-containing protein [Streptomyces sp. NPDC051921]|uniref:right-handed parallel beta-helix repeat-containing protein n=1 Tax=Streptomyces sp. NPDC051921 TaxID=3155806 RepID=UPI00342C40A3